MTPRGCSTPAARDGGQEWGRESERHGDSETEGGARAPQGPGPGGGRDLRGVAGPRRLRTFVHREGGPAEGSG